MTLVRRGLTLVGLILLLGVGVRLVTFSPRPAPPPQPLASLASATAWLNTSEPVTPASLEGRVTLIVFWAYSNAQVLPVLPVIAQWYARYHDRGLEILGVHTPEFPFERSVANVRAAVERLAIPYPVAVDSDRRIWAAFQVHEWPSYYVAGPEGVLLGFQVGAGHEPEIELYVRGLLAEHGYHPGVEPAVRRVGLRSVLGDVLRSSQPDLLWSSGDSLWSPEMVFQLPLGEWFVGPQAPVGDQPRVYRVPEPLPLHAAALDGVWQFEDDRVRVVGPTGRLVVHYRAARCHLIVEGTPGATLEVRVDGGPVPPALAGPDVVAEDSRTVVRLDQPRPYTLVRGAATDAHTLDVVLPRDAAVYACTFS